jgi:putative membrane protein
MMGYHTGGWDGGDWVAMALMMLAFWGIVVAVVVWAIRSARGAGDRDAVPPERVLADRFARGEIDDDEYRRRHDVLTGAIRDRR